MALIPLSFKPGVNRENTDYADEGGWYSCDMIRFRSGQPEKIGGWQKYTTQVFLGVCNALYNWLTLSSQNLLAIGTHLKQYIEYGAQLYDITPIRRTVVLANPFATTNGSTTVVVTDAGHGAMTGDFVTYSGATGFNGLAAGDLNKEFQITLVIDANSYRITVGVTPNATSSGGGATVTSAYQINVGQPVQTFGDGWGSSTWGRGTWGSGATIVSTSQLRIWGQTNYGEDFLFNVRDAGLYYWRASSGLATRAVALNSLSGANQTPTVATSILFTDQRFVVAFGCNPIGSSTQDPLFIRWASQESLTDWNPTGTNTSSGQRLGAGNYIIGHRKLKQEILVWTDSDLYSMQYTGVPYTYGFDFLARNISVAGPNAMNTAGDVAYWMGLEKFYRYDGRVQTLRCDILRYIFDDINVSLFWQVMCGVNERFTEIIWFYPSASSQSINRYAIYNYSDDVWYFGTLARSGWLDTHNRPYPVAASSDGYIYSHEYSIDDGSTNPPSAINSYIESANFDLDNGDRMMFVTRLIPDVAFTGSTAAIPTATVTLKVRDYPGKAYAQTTAATVTSSSSTGTPELFSNYIDLRLRGRQMAFRIESGAAGVQWQLGKSRIEARPDGRRG